MKVPYSWLKDYVDAKTDPAKLAHLLTMAGVNVAACEKSGDDHIFEFEITANRPDCLSTIGVAREVAAILGKRLKLPKELKNDSKPLPAKNKGKLPLEIKLEAPELCFRYTARIIRNVDVKTSPDWLRERIVSAGLRPVNNIVDITNFVLLETGQPMHAFDLDRIKGAISVRRASKGEKIITIDNNSRECTEDTLVIADEDGPVAIAGIMGGLNTEVSNITKNILLESAFFDPVSVRRASRALGISSESSYRFERRIDNSMVVRASERAKALIISLAGGESGEFADMGDKRAFTKTIDFQTHSSNSLLGISINKGEQAKILKSLGFYVNVKKNSLKVTVPTFREDIKSEIDLIEEIARIYGYDNIPLTLPGIVGNTVIKNSADLFQDSIRDLAVRLGLCEIITYSLISRKGLKFLGETDRNTVAIKNPISIDGEIMRPSLMPGMLGVIAYNLNRKARRMPLFEIGKVYAEVGNSYTEEPVLSIGLAGVKREGWEIQKEEFGFFDLKGAFEKIFKELKLENVLFKKDEKKFLDKNFSAKMEHDGELLGFLGEVDGNICKDFDIEKRVFYGELYLKKLFSKVSLRKKYTPYTKFPSIERDISVILDENVASHDITSIVKNLGENLVKNITLVDCYKGKQIPDRKRGFLYRIEYRSDEKTLEDAEVDTLHSRIKEALAHRLNVIFR